MQPSAKITLWKDIIALEKLVVQGREHRSGVLVHLPKGTELTLSGDGFSDRTVTAECQGCLYFVFLQDIDSPNNYDVT